MSCIDLVRCSMYSYFDSAYLDMHDSTIYSSIQQLPASSSRFERFLWLGWVHYLLLRFPNFPLLFPPLLLHTSITIITMAVSPRIMISLSFLKLPHSCSVQPPNVTKILHCRCRISWV